MTQAAVIQRVASVAGNFSDAAPGHRFNLYFPIWRDDWSADNNHKKAAIADCTGVPPRVADLLDALRRRQDVLFDTYAEGLRISALSTAPFATGLGNEHPVENGFAFLTPYGLPYLAGSGVKGVLRRAAEDLALLPEDYCAAASAAPTLLDVWWLFGFEGASGAWWPLTGKEEKNLPDEAKAGRAVLRNRFRVQRARLVERLDLPAFICRVIPPGKDRTRYLADPRQFLNELDNLRGGIQTRGALTFWDVFPRPPSQGPFKDRLAVEIMTPHYTDYYQHGGTPNDAGQPNPIPFLAVPSGASFDFYVTCAAHDLPEQLRQSWKPLLQAIFDHAFDWLGFGAKTAVGYGVMCLDRSAEEARREAQRAVVEEREREEAERRRREQDAGKAAEERAAFESLPESEKAFRRFADGLAVLDTNGPLEKDRYPDFSGLVNALAEQAQAWPDAAERRRAADLLTDAFDRFGWFAPGLKPDKRKKQETKRRRMVADVRAGSIGAQPGSPDD
ncbi:MAG: type III-B CRISPR module RAMP protein Cmr6 [Chromatiaceae bacterium]|jgi:CRISPR-associated protein Cmr6|nr:type III-B CRISPR module RAMP protein Cmr6 [Chromatiaceae bacterium]